MPGLMDLKQLKCKTCGEPLIPEMAQDGVIVCGVCGYATILPKENATDKVRELLSHGDSFLDTAKFDDAYTMFARAAEEDSDEPEAYFGMALAEFRIQYVKEIKDDGKTRLQAIVHAISPDSFCNNINFRKAVNKATAKQREEYERRANDIDHIRDQFYKFKNSGLKYDCFLCLKVRDDMTGNMTPESRIADEIYTYLRRKGFKPFYSEAVLGSVTGDDYEAHILYALQSAECMVLVCFDEAHLRTKWVKNEYTRFLKLVNDEEKESDSITIVFGNRPVEKLPGKNGKIQGISGLAGDRLERVYNFVERHTPEARKRKEAEEKARAEAEEMRVQAMIEQKMRQANMNASAAPSQPIAPLLMRASQEMSMGRLDKANEYYDRILDLQPECAEAWFGMMLLEFDCCSDDELLKKIDSAYSIDEEKHRLLFNVTSSQYGAQVKRYADSALIARYNTIIQACNKPDGWFRMMLQDMGCRNDKELKDKIYRSYACDKKKTDFLKQFRESKYGERVRNCATGELKSRYDELWAASNDAPSWYNVWLTEFGCRNDADAVKTLEEACCFDEKKNQLLFKFKDSEYGQAVASCATGELLARYNQLMRKCNDCISALRNKSNDEKQNVWGEREKLENELVELRKREADCRAIIAAGEKVYKKRWLGLLLCFVLFVGAAVAWFFALGSVIKYAIGDELAFLLDKEKFSYMHLFNLDKTGLEFAIKDLKAVGVPAFTGWGMTIIKGKATLGFVLQLIIYSIVTALFLYMVMRSKVSSLIVLAVLFSVAWWFIIARYWMAQLDVASYAKLFTEDLPAKAGFSGDMFKMSQLSEVGISKFGGWGLTFPPGIFIQPLVYGVACSLVMTVILGLLNKVRRRHIRGYRKNKLTYKGKYNAACDTIYKLESANKHRDACNDRIKLMDRNINRCDAALRR